jgi:hypothetical protein
MRRVLSAGLIVFSLAAGPAAAEISTPPRATLDGFVCERAANALDRVIAVAAVMRPLAGTQRMQMRFVLERRAAGSYGFAPVQGGDLGRWLEPTPATLGQQSTDVWRLRKLVANLPGPAAYRFRVSFHWLGAGSTLLGHSLMTSETCSEPQ